MIGATHPPATAVRCRDLDWVLDPAHPAAAAMREHGDAAPGTTDPVMARIRPGMKVVDVGAGFGWFALLMARAVGPDGHVWAFEPVWRFRRQLHRHLAVNGLDDRVTVVPYGLSDAVRQAPVAVGDGSATLHDTGAWRAPGRETVELRPLDRMAAELGMDRVDLLVADLDGHEPAFLRGAAGTLRRHRPTLVLGFAQDHLHEAGDDVRGQARQLHALDYLVCRPESGVPYAGDREFLRDCGNFVHRGHALARPAGEIAGMPVRLATGLDDLMAQLDLQVRGIVLEDDIDVATNACELHGRKRRDAEVLCTLAASRPGPCLDLGTSHGRSAFKLATNVGSRFPVTTVNMLPEHAAEAGELVTHVLSKEEIGRYWRENGAWNCVQVHADTRTWAMPDDLRELSIVFVDACHDEAAVYGDAMRTWDRLAPGGFMVFHDFCPERRHVHGWIDAVMRGVERFVAGTGSEGPVHHLRGSWMGVVRKEGA